MKILCTALLLGWGLMVKAQQANIAFKQLDSLQLLRPKKVLVHIYTNWCNYCKAMEETVYKNKAVAKYLSESYYFVKLDAEDKTPIFYRKHQFTFSASRGVHGLAVALGSYKGKVIFPSICILNEHDEIIYQHQGLISAAELLRVLRYFND